MKKKIINVFLMALISLVAVGTVVSCKDYEEDNYSELNGKFTNLKELTSNLEGRIVILEKAKEELEGDIAALKQELGTSNDDPDRNGTIYARIIYLQTIVDQIQTSINNINSTLNGHSDSIKTMWECLYGSEGESEAILGLVQKVSNNEEAIKELQKLISVSESDTANWNGAVSDAKEALAQANANYKAIIELEKLLGDDFSDFKNAFLGSLTDGEGNWTSLSDYLTGKLGDYTSLEDFNKALGRLSKNEEDLKDLKAFRERIDETVADLEAQTANLFSSLGLVSNSLNKYVSSVLIQGTDNPVFGSFAFPANISSNVLAAYYGDVKDLKFPTNEPYNYVDAQNALTAKDLEMMGVAAGNQFSYNGRVVSGMKENGKAEAGNAGTLYLTVNPNTVNAERTTAVLVNSQDVPSGVLLSPLKRSDKVLNFGYTRAANNGFYEAAATVAPDAVDGVSPRISYDDLKGLKDEIKDAVNAIRNKGNVDITGLIYSVYSISSNILDAQAAKFSWLDDSLYLAEDGKSYLVKQIERSTYSQYALAATAVHPLSFAFAKDVHYDEFPGINKVEDIIGDIFNKIEDAIPNVDVDDLNIHIEIEKFKFNKVSLSEDVFVTVKIENVTDSYGNPIDIPATEVNITSAVEAAVNEALGGSVSEDVSNYLEDVVKQLNDQVGQINDIIDQLRDINEIGNKLDEIEDKIYDYLSRGENLLLKFVNNANNLLQPMMLAKTADSYVVLSRSASAPTKFSASSMTSDGIILRPTTYSAEVLAPAFKKFVGVANVYKDGKSAQGGDANCQAALKAANSSSEGFCTVQEGDWNKAQFKVSSQYKDYVYEIVYTAADYSGKIVVKRFYIELV